MLFTFATLVPILYVPDLDAKMTLAGIEIDYTQYNAGTLEYTVSTENTDASLMLSVIETYTNPESVEIPMESTTVLTNGKSVSNTSWTILSSFYWIPPNDPNCRVTSITIVSNMLAQLMTNASKYSVRMVDANKSVLGMISNCTNSNLSTFTATVGNMPVQPILIEMQSKCNTTLMECMVYHVALNYSRIKQL